MRQLRIYIFLLSLLLSANSLFAEQDIPKIGLVDSSKIISNYFQDSKAMRDLIDLKETIIAVSQEIKDDIFELKRKKVDAENTNDRGETLRLENLITEKERFLKEYIQIKNTEYKNRQMLAVDDTFLGEIAEAIEYIAISEGFTIILEKQNPIFLYFAMDVDVTDKVLAYLLEKAGRGDQ